MESRLLARARLSGVAFLMALSSGCGGGSAPLAPDVPSEPVAPPAPISQLLKWNVFPTASAVLGQAGFDQAGRGQLADLQGNPAIAADGFLFAATGDAMKVFESYTAGGASPRFTLPFLAASDVSIRGEKLVLIDGESVLIYNKPPSASVPPDVRSTASLGCGPNAMNIAQSGYLTPQGHLIVADYGNSRVLIWNPDRVPASGILPEPTVVVGQRNKDLCIPNDEDGDELPDEAPSAFTLSSPRSVWSDGNKLVVVDGGNHRVLIWDTVPTADHQPADHVIGQPDFASNAPNRGAVASEFTLSQPMAVDVNEAGQIAVADAGNNRVLVWDTIPLGTGTAPPRHVLGQSNFLRNLANDSDQIGSSDIPSAQTLSFPAGVRFYDRNLIVSDKENNRILVFPASN